MNETLVTNTVTISPEERSLRLAEFRRLGWEYRSPAMIVYPPPKHACPQPGCKLRIVGIRFNLDQLGDAVAFDRWLRAWWQGPGLIGRCPGCSAFILYCHEAKQLASQAMIDMANQDQTLLPEQWKDVAHISSHSITDANRGESPSHRQPQRNGDHLIENMRDDAPGSGSKRK